MTAPTLSDERIDATSEALEELVIAVEAIAHLRRANTVIRFLLSNELKAMETALEAALLRARALLSAPADPLHAAMGDAPALGMREGDLQASSECYVCGKDTPHGHDLSDRIAWIQAQACRILGDWSKLMVIRAGDDSAHEAMLAQRAEAVQAEKTARWHAGIDWADAARTYEGMVNDGSITLAEAKRRLGEDPAYSDSAWAAIKGRLSAAPASPTPPAVDAQWVEIIDEAQGDPGRSSEYRSGYFDAYNEVREALREHLNSARGGRGTPNWRAAVGEPQPTIPPANPDLQPGGKHDAGVAIPSASIPDGAQQSPCTGGKP
jgi:hypothetical protein